jgi:hypothetical protein
LDADAFFQSRARTSSADAPRNQGRPYQGASLSRSTARACRLDRLAHFRRLCARWTRNANELLWLSAANASIPVVRQANVQGQIDPELLSPSAAALSPRLGATSTQKTRAPKASTSRRALRRCGRFHGLMRICSPKVATRVAVNRMSEKPRKMSMPSNK